MIKAKSKEFIVVIYSADLKVSLDKSFFSERSKIITEFIYVLHEDASEPHYHIYLNFLNKISVKEVQRIFYNAKCFVKRLADDETVLSTLYYFTNGFRLPFETNYSTKKIAKES